MDVGAIKLAEDWPHLAVLRECLAEIPDDAWQSVHPDGVKASTEWKAARFYRKKGTPMPLLEQVPKIREALEFFECPILGAAFNVMGPGAWIGPHRDMSGTLEWGRIRLHVPVVTNPGVDFRVGGERVVMKEGELWALNASHRHSVRNDGDEARIHFIVEAVVNDWVRELLPPKGIKYYLNATRFFAHATRHVVTSSVRDPRYLRVASRLTRRYVLGQGDPVN